MMALLMACVAWAQETFSYTYGGTTLLYTPIGGDSVEVTVYDASTMTPYSGQITIPETVYDVNASPIVYYRVAAIGSGAFGYCPNLNYVTLPATLRDINYGAFEECTALTDITIPAAVKWINNRAFYNCTSLAHVVSMPGVPPEVQDDAFAMDMPRDFTSIRYMDVPTGSAFAYREATWTANFDSINGIFLGASNVEDVTPNDATILWYIDADIADYTIRIYTADTLYREYKVDTAGHMTRMKMPVYRMRLDTAYSSTDFCVLSINSMQSSTTYTYEITGTNPDPNKADYREIGMFRTDNTITGIEDPESDQNASQTKILRNGQVYLIYKGRIYDVRGTEIKHIIINE